MTNKLVPVILCILLNLFCVEGVALQSTPELHKVNFVTIASGSVTGVYFPIGGGICRMVNKHSKTDKIRCSVEATPATIFNINALRNNSVVFAIAQSDWIYYAYRGENIFKSFGPMLKLRSILTMHTEAFTVIASAKSGIKTLDDLKGKRVNIGNPGSGIKATMGMLMKKKGWDKKTFKFASDLSSSEQSQALCDNKVDAIVYVVGHVSGSIQEAASTCDIRVVKMSPQDLDLVMSDQSYYINAVIPGGLYQGAPDPVDTFGVKSLLVASADTDNETVYKVIQTIMGNLKNFKAMHPSLSDLTIENMIPDENIAPIHEGARRYYKEAGYLN